MGDSKLLLVGGFVITSLATLFILVQLSFANNPSMFIIFLLALPIMILISDTNKICEIVTTSCPSKQMQAMVLACIGLTTFLSVMSAFASSSLMRVLIGVNAIIVVCMSTALFAQKYKMIEK